MSKEVLEKLIKESKDLDSKYSLEEIIQSILDDNTLTDSGKLKFIRIKLEMNKASKEFLEILETELKKLKDYHTAIISLSTDDFQYWKLINNLKGDVLDYKRKFKINNTTYHCISSVTDLCSLRFDNFIETDNAKLNKEYLQIISLLNVQKSHV
jgi:hypothetical protein